MADSGRLVACTIMLGNSRMASCQAAGRRPEPKQPAASRSPVSLDGKRGRLALHLHD